MCESIDSRISERQPVVTRAKLGGALRLEINLAAGGPGSMRVEKNPARFYIFRIGIVPVDLPLFLSLSADTVFNPFFVPERREKKADRGTGGRRD